VKDNASPTIGLRTVTAIAIANMIGTGVFTSLGYQVQDIQSVFALLMLWVIGGITAFCGAASYAELAAALPRSGGEYHLLSKIYHPSLGFLSGWISATAGFSAPTAVAAMAFATYMKVVFPALPETHVAAGVILLFAVIHALSVRGGGDVHDFFTLIKLIVIVLFIGFGFFISAPQPITISLTAADWQPLVSPSFAVALVYVAYAYTGWNASVYVVNELREPQKNLPRALFISTLSVMGLYTLLNFIFLYAAPMNELAGKVEIGFLAGRKIFGDAAGDAIAVMIALLMLSTVSAMVFVGARITQVMGEDFPALSVLAKRSAAQTPVNAILVQTVITLLFIYTSTFEQVMIYAAFSMIITGMLTVLGVYVLRVRQPDLVRPYKTFGYPFTPAAFLFSCSWVLYYTAKERPIESAASLVLMGVGGVLYLVLSRKRTGIFSA
jgi:basic amino acid/polyamine antiporter, APA family